MLRYPCPECEYIASRTSSLKVHVETKQKSCKQYFFYMGVRERKNNT